MNSLNTINKTNDNINDIKIQLFAVIRCCTKIAKANSTRKLLNADLYPFPQ